MQAIEIGVAQTAAGSRRMAKLSSPNVSQVHSITS
jgi:hypothetical protein